MGLAAKVLARAVPQVARDRGGGGAEFGRKVRGEYAD